MIIAPSLKIAKSKTICIIKFLTHRTPKTFLKIVKVKIRFVQGREGLFTIGHISKPRPERDSSSNQPRPPSGILFSGIFICFPWLGIGFHSTCFLTGASARNPRDIWQKAVFCPENLNQNFNLLGLWQKGVFCFPKIEIEISIWKDPGFFFYKKRHFASQKAKETLLFASWNNEEDSVTRSSRDNIAPIFNQSS